MPFVQLAVDIGRPADKISGDRPGHGPPVQKSAVTPHRATAAVSVEKLQPLEIHADAAIFRGPRNPAVTAVLDDVACPGQPNVSAVVAAPNRCQCRAQPGNGVPYPVRPAVRRLQDEPAVAHSPAMLRIAEIERPERAGHVAAIGQLPVAAAVRRLQDNRLLVTAILAGDPGIVQIQRLHREKIGVAQPGTLAGPMQAIHTVQNRILLANRPAAVFIGHGDSTQVSRRTANLCVPVLTFVRGVQDQAAIAHSPAVRSLRESHTVKIRAHACALDLRNSVRRRCEHVDLQDAPIVADNPAVIRRPPENGPQCAGCVAFERLPVAGDIAFGRDDQQQAKNKRHDHAAQYCSAFSHLSYSLNSAHILCDRKTHDHDPRPAQRSASLEKIISCKFTGNQLG